MKALIIGGSGFVGSYLSSHLKNDCHMDVAVTKMPNENFDSNTIPAYDLDILKKESIIELFKTFQPDYIFHLAAMSSVAMSWKNPGLTVDINIKGALNVLDALRDSELKARILLIGSGEEYGRIKPEETPLKEDNLVRPGNIYAATKACQNMIGKIYADAYNLDIISVRAFNHIGPKQSSIFVVSDFSKQIAEIEAGISEPILKVGNLNALRDFTDVRDVVRAYSLLVQKGLSGETYNVGSGKAVTIRSILDSLLQLSSSNITIVEDPQKVRPIDIPEITADISKLNDITGWYPEIPISQTLKETLDYWRNITSPK